MKKRYLLFTMALLALGEITLLLFARTVPDVVLEREALFLLLAFALSFFMDLINKFLDKFQKSHLSLELVLVCVMIYYIVVNYQAHSSTLVNFAFLLVYSLIICGCFIFRDLIAHLYLQCTAFLMGLVLYYGGTVQACAIFLVFYILAIVFHNDYIHFRSTRKRLPIPVLPASIVTILSLLLLTWMHYTNDYFSSYLRQHWQESTQALFSPTLPKWQESLEDFGVPLPKQNPFDNQQTSASSLGNRLQLDNQLRFPDVDIDKVPPQVLFEVKISTSARHKLQQHGIPILWRAKALDRYSPEQRRWDLSDVNVRAIHSPRSQIVLEHDLLRHFQVLEVQQEFLLRATIDETVLHLGTPYFLKLAEIDIDSEKNIFPREALSQYTLISHVPLVRRPQSLTLAYSSPRHRTPPLQYSDYYRLASRITRGIFSPYDKAEAIAQYLRRHYQYDLSPKITGGQDDTYEFLFNKKRGHCQHFSSAMVLLLRSIDIPSRIAIGFREGVWSPQRSSYIVSGIHAHAWVEVKFAETGWLPFDPVAIGSPALENKIAEKNDEIRRIANNTIYDNPPQRRPQSQLAESKDGSGIDQIRKKRQQDEQTRRRDKSPRKKSPSRQQSKKRLPKKSDEDSLAEQTQREFRQRLTDDRKQQENDRRPSQIRPNDRRDFPRRSSDKQDERDKPFSRKNRDNAQPDSNRFGNRENNEKNRNFADRKFTDRESHEKNRDTDTRNFADNRNFNDNRNFTDNRRRSDRISGKNPHPRRQRKKTSQPAPKPRRQPRQNPPRQDDSRYRDDAIAVPETKDANPRSTQPTYQPRRSTSNPQTPPTGDSSRSTVNFAVMGFINFLLTLAAFALALFLIIHAPNLWAALMRMLRKPPDEERENETTLEKPRKSNWFFQLFTKKPDLSHRERVVEAYLQLSHSLKKRNLAKKAGQTPYEYAQVLYHQAKEQRIEVQRLTELFLKARYSPHDVTAMDANKAEQYSQTVSKAIARAS